MPATEFNTVDEAYAKVRSAYGARSNVVAELSSSREALAKDRARVTAAEESLVPLQEAYLVAVQELQEAIAQLSNL